MGEEVTLVYQWNIIHKEGGAYVGGNTMIKGVQSWECLGNQFVIKV